MGLAAQRRCGRDCCHKALSGRADGRETNVFEWKQIYIETE